MLILKNIKLPETDEEWSYEILNDNAVEVSRNVLFLLGCYFEESYTLPVDDSLYDDEDNFKKWFDFYVVEKGRLKECLGSRHSTIGDEYCELMYTFEPIRQSPGTNRLTRLSINDQCNTWVYTSLQQAVERHTLHDKK